MPNRLLLSAIVLLAGAALLLHRCTDAAPDADAPSAGASSATTEAAASGAVSVASAADAAAQRARTAAIQDAVSTLHRYLTDLGGADRAKADRYWSGGRPADAGEADLRTLGAGARDVLRALRIENGAPKALDGAAVPAALEIPVTLRASLAGAPAQRYRGWYRLRRKITGEGWEITSAGIDRVPATQ